MHNNQAVCVSTFFSVIPCLYTYTHCSRNHSVLETVQVLSSMRTLTMPLWHNAQAPCARRLLGNAVLARNTMRTYTAHCMYALMSLLLLANSAARTASYDRATDSLPPYNINARLIRPYRVLQSCRLNGFVLAINHVTFHVLAVLAFTRHLCIAFEFE